MGMVKGEITHHPCIHVVVHDVGRGDARQLAHKQVVINGLRGHAVAKEIGMPQLSGGGPHFFDDGRGQGH